MDQYYLNLLFIGASFALYMGIAIWARAGSTSEFYTAGRGIHPITNGMATAADWMSAASFISMAGLIAFNGYSASAYLMGWTGGYVLLALCLAPYLRKFGSFTVPEFIGDRYYSRTARLVAVLCLVVASLTYVIGQMTGVGVAFSRFLQVSNTTGLLIGAGVVFFYAVLGGMKGITYTQVAQYVVLVFAYTVPAIFISLQLTGNPIPGLGLFSNYEASGEPLLVTLNQTLADLGFASYTEQDTSPSAVINMFLFTLTLMVGTAGLPHVIIRFFTVPKVSDARLSAGWALVFIAIVYLTAPAVGAMARLNIMTTIWPGAVAGEESQAMQIDEAPAWFENWATTGLLGWEDMNDDGRLQYFNDQGDTLPPVAEASGAEANELTNFNADILVLANPEIAQLPGWVIALVAAGGMAAALSTAAGLLMAISSAISHDLVKRSFKPDISESGELWWARGSMAAAVVVATWLGLNPPGFAAQTVALAFGIAAATIFPALMMGIFSRRINNTGAVSGMLTGLIFTVVYIFMHKGWFFVAGTNQFEDTIDGSLLGVQSTAIGCIGAALNFIVAFLVSARTAETPEDVQRMIDNVRVPRGASGAQAH